MKQFKWRKLAAVLLVVCLSVGMVTPASAAGLFSSGRSSGLLGSLTDRWNNLWNSIFGGAQEEEPAEDAGNTESGDLTLVEDETTVTEGTDLRASTYSLELLAGGTEDLKYFPVTLYDYDTRTINNATHQVEVDAGLENQWNGIYFSAGSPEAESYTYTTSGVTYSQEQDGDISWNSLAPTNTTRKSTGYYVQLTSDEQYYPAYVTRTSSGPWWDKENNFTLEYKKNNQFYTVSTGSDGHDCPEPSQNAGVKTVIIDGWFDNYYTYVALYESRTGGSETTGTLDYAAWNFWNKDTKNNDYGQYTYSGLVEPTLDAYKNIRFTKPDGGIFNSDSTVKTIYTNVEMPFVYDSATKYYTFDASQNGVYFKQNATQGSTTARSGGRLYFDNNTPQGVGGASFGDGSKTVWAPFDSTTDLTGSHSTVNMNYHFGMAATIPFTMTANGRIDPNDNDSAPIEFTFSGDDDVWVFVDGQLVLDLGGIHNRLDATINFADNTWTLSKSNSVEVDVDDYNGAAISGKLCNDGSTTGKLGQTLTTFAASESHELTIFYLERGAGSSNCRISFNLPMKDTVSVTKQITQSKDESGTYPLTTSEQAQVDSVDFGFTLYEGTDPVANARYNVVNANGQVIDTRTTNNSGYFTLKNGQTARFVVDIPEAGQSYQVVEDWNDNSAYTQPDYSYSGNAAYGFEIDGVSYTEPNPSLPGTTENATSSTITVKGSEEAEDSLNFVCTNYWIHVNTTTITANDDRIVIDYGLPVVISPLDNDVAQNGEKSLVSVTRGVFGTASIEGNTIRYTLNKQLTDVEVLTYTVEATGENGSDKDTNTAKIYIIPATTMYYEEDFSNLVTFTDNWSPKGTSNNATQEPGVVGTIGDSPYGSDAAYKGYVGDSNETSRYVDTTNSSASFSYSFTGTGTSFFASTSGSSAVLSIQVTAEDGTQVAYQNRNTKYVSTEETDVGTLYNIPVYTIEGLNYGTYTVNVTVLKAVAVLNYGKDFYLDGIRVVSPLNPLSENGEVAVDAYSDDGEAGMVSATLRQKLLKDYTKDGEDGLVWTNDGFVVFTDSNGRVETADEYKSNGPKEELYLNAGQSVTFSLANWDADSNKIYLGIKAPVKTQTITIGSRPIEITNSADCYYDITNYGEIKIVDGVSVVTFTITAGDELISLTNIKVTGNPDFAIVPPDDVDTGDSVDVEM